MHVDELTTAPEKEWHQPFLKALAKTANVAVACRVANISREMAYRDRRNDKLFKKQWKIALSYAVDALEKEAWRRAVKGTRKPVFYKGVQCGFIREYSDALLMLLLKASKPAQYREPSQFNQTQVTNVEQPVVIAYEDTNRQGQEPHAGTDNATANDATANNADAAPETKTVS